MKSDKQKQNLYIEILCFILLLLVAFLPRIGFVSIFPSHPTSDFQNLINFGLSFKLDWLAKGNIYWKYFSAGLPLILSLLFRIFPYDPEVISRWATVFITGSTALIPFLVWRDTLSLRARVIAGIFMSLWPGQILFSGIPAQDNWVLPTSVMLAALSVRILVNKEVGRPILGALLYVLTVSIRQEMLICMFPVAVVVVIGSDKKEFIKRSLVAVTIAALAFGFLIVQRGMSTGRYSLSSDHMGLTILGSYIPGSGRGWGNPLPYLAIAAPEELQQDDYQKISVELALKELFSRPRYHLIRAIGTVSFHLFQAEDNYYWWSLSKQGVLSADKIDEATLFISKTDSWIKLPALLVQFFFFSSLFYVIFVERRKLLTVLPVLMVIFLKVSIHSVIVSEPRYYLTVIALQIVVFSVLVDGILLTRKTGPIFLGVLFGGGMVAGLIFLAQYAQKTIDMYDGIRQKNYAFPLMVEGLKVNCVLDKGVLLYQLNSGGAIRLEHQDPAPGEFSRISCSAFSETTMDIYISIMDGYEQGGTPERILQIVYVNGERIIRHDVADEIFLGWQDVYLGKISPGQPFNFSLEVKALKPDDGWGWGDVSNTAFKITSIK